MRALGELPPQTTFGVKLRDLINQARVGHWQFSDQDGPWVVGQLVEWRGQLQLPVSQPPRSFALWVAFQFADSTVIAEFPISERDEPIDLSTSK